VPSDALLRFENEQVGDVVLQHVVGARAIDLGYGRPEVTAWARRRTGQRLSIVERGALLRGPADRVLADHADASFDVVFCLSTFPHLGTEETESRHLAHALVVEAARLLRPGGVFIVEIANPRSLRGLWLGIRHPITVITGTGVTDDDGLTRWENVRQVLSMAPRALALEAIHGIGVAVPHDRTLDIPVLSGVVRAFSRVARDRPLLRRFGGTLLLVLRRARVPVEPRTGEANA
jgi:SAM-dependent methyltransferase